MDPDTLRPLVSGLVGGLVAAWLGSRASKWLPQTFQGIARETLMHEHRAAVRFGNALFFVGLVIGIAMYKVLGFASNDWTPLLVGVGFAGAAPMLALFSVSKARGKDPAGAFFAFAISQGMPMSLTYGLLGAAALMLPFGLYRLGT